MFKFNKTLLAIGLLLSSVTQAGISPLGFALISPVQLPSKDYTVAGARFSTFWGQHASVYGLDFGVIGNVTNQHFGGIGVSGLFNLNQGSATIVGLQFAGITNININKASIYGLQIAAGVNYNKAESTLVGFQLALGNYSPFTHVIGAQLGIYNKAGIVRGLQIGLINDTEVLHGIQIGLVNFNRKGLFSVAPILNIGF